MRTQLLLLLYAVLLAPVSVLSDSNSDTVESTVKFSVLLRGKPDEEISQIRNTRKVIKNGIIHDSAALYKALGVR